MAKFCNQCGKPLQDGEVCSCTQQPVQPPVNMQPISGYTDNTATPSQTSAENAQFYQANQAAYNQQNVNANAQQFQQQTSQVVNQVKTQTMNIFSQIVPFFKHPITETKNLVAMDNMSCALPFILFHIVAVFLLSVIESLLIHARVGNFGGYINIPYVKAVLLITIITAIADFALAGILMLTAKSIFKADTSYAKMLSLVGGKCLISTCVLVVGMVLLQLSATLGLLVLCLGVTLSTLILIIGYCNTIPMSEDMKVYSLFLSNIFIVIIEAICFYIMYKSVINQFMDYFSYFF